IMLTLPVMGGLLACTKSEPPPPPPVAAPATTVPAPVSLSGVALGNAIGEDKRVAVSVETFGAKDTIYATVETAGTGHAKLRALWSFVKGDKTAKVDETTIEFDSAAPAVNEFHISKPSGWPKGDYKLEIFLGDATAPAVTKTFKVG
ncbi:MAG: hypothetical protein DMF79_08265, partial [Acidobacteria bacterium]